MRTTLMEAINNKVESIVIPTIGGGAGMVPFRMIAKLMKKGYEQIEKSKYIGEIEGKRNNGYEWWYEYDRKQPVCNRTY